MKKSSWLFRAILSVTLIVTAAATATAQTTGHIRGTVIDAASEQPLPYAAVAVQSTGTGTISDEDGAFALPPMPVGRHTIVVTLLGYESATVREVMVSSTKETVLEIAMIESVNVLEEIVVRPDIKKDEPLNPMVLAGARMLSIEEASRFAGGSANSIAIRGNSPQSLQWKLEGVEIPNPNHFPDVTSVGGGVLTAFSSNMLGNSDFFTGAFPAQYTNALSGVFDMMLRNGNNQTYEHSAQLGTLGMELASEGPFKKGKGSYLFNVRYSTMSLLGNMIDGLNEIAGVKYGDLSFKINVPTRRAGTFTL